MLTLSVARVAGGALRIKHAAQISYSPSLPESLCLEPPWGWCFEVSHRACFIRADFCSQPCSSCVSTDRHALDIREHSERKLERANNLYMELSAIMLQLEMREKELLKYVSHWSPPVPALAALSPVCRTCCSARCCCGDHVDILVVPSAFLRDFLSSVPARVRHTS